MKTISIYIVDDEPVVRKGLQLLLGRHPEVSICGEAEAAEPALKEILTLKPNLAIVDLTLKGKDDGFQLIRKLRHFCPSLRILVFSMHGEKSFLRAAFQAGAHGYVTKAEGTDKLLEAIHLLAMGEAYPSALADWVIPHSKEPPHGRTRL